MARKPPRRSRPAGAEWSVVAVLVALVAMGWKFLSWGVVVLVVVPAILWVLAAQWEWLHVHRRRLAPLMAGFAVAGLGLASLAVGSWWSAAVYGALVFGIGWAIHLEDSSDHRVYFTVCLLAAAGWSVALHLLPLHDRWLDLTASWLVLVILAIAFWWTDRRVARAVQIEDQIRSWPEIVRNTDLAGTRRVDYRQKPEGGWRMRLVWSPGQKMVDSVTKQARLLESLMDAPRQSVVIEPDGDNPNAVIAECSPVSSLVSPDWDAQPLVSITDPLVTAHYSNGDVETVRRWTPGVGSFHVLRAGVTRSGKSWATRHSICAYAPAEDVVGWGIDLKGGMAFRPMAPMLDWFVTTQDDAVNMLEALVRICDARSAFAAEQGWDVWQPSREHPVIMVWIDETARVLGFQAPSQVQSRALAAATAVAQLGAGLGVLVEPATQFATLEALGSSQFREQLTYTECFRMRSEGTAQHFLPNAPQGVEPAHLPSARKGVCYIDAQGEFRSHQAQKPPVTDEQMGAVVAEFWDTTPELDVVSVAAAGVAYAERDRWALVDGKPVKVPAGSVSQSATPNLTKPVAAVAAPEPEPAAPAAAVVPSWAHLDLDGEPTFRELVAVERAAMSPEERRAEVARQAAAIARLRPRNPEEAPALVLELMRKVHPDPIGPRHAMEATGLAESTVHKLLCRWKDEGRVEHVGYGKYRLVAADVPA
jgi:hypothetical protein